MSIGDVIHAIRHYGSELWVDLEYPRRSDSRVKSIRIGLTDVRAADDILITYDFDRDGWVIKRPGEEKVPGDGPEWIEAAFIKAWSGEEAKPTNVRLFRPGELTIIKDRRTFSDDVTVYIAYAGCVFARVNWSCRLGIDQTGMDNELSREEHDKLVDDLATFIVQRLTEGVK